MAVGEVWHELHVYHEAVKCVRSDMLRWNGYRQDHASGGDIVIQSDQENCRHVRMGNYVVRLRASTDASGKGSVWL